MCKTQCFTPPPMVDAPPRSHNSRARPLIRANSHRDGARPRHHPILSHTVDVLLELSRKVAHPTPPPTKKKIATQMRMMAMMLKTMTLMCFLHAGIPSVTVGGTIAALTYRMFFGVADGGSKCATWALPRECSTVMIWLILCICWGFQVAGASSVTTTVHTASPLKDDLDLAFNASYFDQVFDQVWDPGRAFTFTQDWTCLFGAVMCFFSVMLGFVVFPRDQAPDRDKQSRSRILETVFTWGGQSISYLRFASRFRAVRRLFERRRHYFGLRGSPAAFAVVGHRRWQSTNMRARRAKLLGTPDTSWTRGRLNRLSRVIFNMHCAFSATWIGGRRRKWTRRRRSQGRLAPWWGLHRLLAEGARGLPRPADALHEGRAVLSSHGVKGFRGSFDSFVSCGNRTRQPRRNNQKKNQETKSKICTEKRIQEAEEPNKVRLAR